MDTVQFGDLAVGFRDATPDDESVVFAAWLQGHRKHGDWPRLLSSRRYFDAHKLTIARLIARGRVLVACSAERPGQVFGFVCWSGDTLHWLYVKQPYRRQGIGATLQSRADLSFHDTRCSHWTETAPVLGWGWRYDPFALETFR